MPHLTARENFSSSLCFFALFRRDWSISDCAQSCPEIASGKHTRSAIWARAKDQYLAYTRPRLSPSYGNDTAVLGTRPRSAPSKSIPSRTPPVYLFL